MEPNEKAILELTADVWNGFVDLEIQHPDDLNEVRFHIHALQNILLARVGARHTEGAVNLRGTKK